MDETTLKIAIAAFIHDIGKFAGRELLSVTADELDRKASDFLPVKSGRYSHHHALYTAEFIERFKDLLPGEFDRPWGDRDGLVKLAASHHNPASPMEWIVAEADRLASGMDREEFDAYENEAIAVGDYQKTRLLPVLECLDENTDADVMNREKYRYAFPLAPLAPQTLFPLPKQEAVPHDKTSAKREYRELFKAFTRGLDELCHRDCIELWFEHFESLVMRYLSHMPAARVGNVVADVSLYDHMKTTAALATALYLYHRDTGTMDAAEVKNGAADKFLIVSGGFHGIQKFIFGGYGDTRKYRAKLIRGRSFYVSVLTELAAARLCRKIGLPAVSVVLTAGGKFTLIAPNTPAANQTVSKVQEEIDAWFYKQSYGETCISLSTVCASPDAFRSGRFPDLQDRINRKMIARKLSRIDMDRFGGVVEDYFDAPEARLCAFCGKRPSDPAIMLPEDQAACRLCADHIHIGERLVKRETLAVLDETASDHAIVTKEPIFGAFHLLFPDDRMEAHARKGKVVKYWNLGLGKDSKAPGGGSLRFYNGYVPTYEEGVIGSEGENVAGDPKTLNDIASLAKNEKNGEKTGIEALGVLKADVDNLGLLMACGLPDRLYSISRLATMSRQVNDFFAVYLPWLLQTDDRFSNVYTVFAGGDDLLFIGPWNAIVTLAPEIARQFNRYACDNPNVHLSAGISIHKAHTPVDAMAEASEAAIEQSKNGGRNRLTLFRETVTLEEVEKLAAIRTALEQWLDRDFLSATMFYRLNTFIDMANREAALVQKSSIHIRDMDCTRWRSMLAYAVERNVGKSIRREEKKWIINEVRGDLAQWLSTWQGKLRIPLWDIQYNRR
jgi:CRISPR-associated protein Csm1